MRAALKVLDEQKGKAKNVDPSLQIIRKLDKEGLLEAFILLALPDEGIAQRFQSLSHTNIENLRRYVKQYVLTGGGNNPYLIRVIRGWFQPQITRIYRIGSIFARQFLVAHGSLVNERRHDRRCLLHVVGLNTIEHILV